MCCLVRAVFPHSRHSQSRPLFLIMVSTVSAEIKAWDRVKKIKMQCNFRQMIYFALWFLDMWVVSELEVLHIFPQSWQEYWRLRWVSTWNLIFCLVKAVLPHFKHSQHPSKERLKSFFFVMFKEKARRKIIKEHF